MASNPQGSLSWKVQSQELDLQVDKVDAIGHIAGSWPASQHAWWFAKWWSFEPTARYDLDLCIELHRGTGQK